MPEKKDVQILLRLPKPLHATIKKLAAADARSMNNYVVRALTEHVKKSK